MVARSRRSRPNQSGAALQRWARALERKSILGVTAHDNQLAEVHAQGLHTGQVLRIMGWR